jgi:ClpP class serine protease
MIELQVLECFPGQRVPSWYPDPERFELSQKELLAYPDPERSQKELLTCNDPGKDSIVRTHGPLAVVELKGFMALEQPRWTRRYGTLDIARAIVELSTHEGITDLGVLVDSGGGQSGSSEPITEALDIAASRLESVEIWVQGMCCSAAYRAVRKYPISATQGSWIGNVGVFVRLWDESRWLEEFWMTVEHIVASGRYKEAWASSGVSEELLENTHSLVVSEARRFQNEVFEDRALSRIDSETLEKINEGYVFDAAGAAKAGLIDEVATRPYFSHSTTSKTEAKVMAKTLRETLEGFLPGRAQGQEHSKQVRAANRELVVLASQVLAKYPPAVRTSAEPTFAALLALDLKNGKVPAGEEVETVSELLKGGMEVSELAQTEQPLSELFLSSLSNSEHVAEVLMGKDMATREGAESAPRVGESVQPPPGLLAFLRTGGVDETALNAAIAKANKRRA